MPTEQEYLDATIKLYDEQAAVYAASIADTAPYEKFYQLFLSALSGEKILDVGSGSGRDMHYFIAQGYDVRAIELSKGQIVYYSPELQERTICGDMRKLRSYFDAEQFDGVWSFASIVHMNKSDAKKSIQNMIEVLKQGGVLWISVKLWRVGMPEEVVKESISIPGALKRYVYWEEEELCDYLRSSGVVIEKTVVDLYEERDSWLGVLAKKT